MPTPAQIEEQVQLEREQMRQGLQKLHNNTRELEAKDYASASVYGVASVEMLIPLVSKRIGNTTNRIHEGKVGRSFKEIHQYLSPLEPEAAAAIAAKVTIDRVFSVNPKQSQVQKITESIGQAIENECLMRHYEATCPGLLNVIKENYWHSSIGTAQKVKVVKTLMHRYDVKQWQNWGSQVRTHLGGWLLDCICEESKWFEIDMRQEGRKRQNYLVPTAGFNANKDQVMATAELFSPLAWPMLIEPNDWSAERPGGYLLNEVMRGNAMVRRGDPGSIQGKTPIEFLNKIQKVAYRLNPFIVEVAETLLKKGVAVGKFIPIVEVPLPPKPVDIAENYDSRKDYRRRAAEVRNTNAQAFRRSCRTRMTMNAVEVFKGREKFFIPWSFDYRGRAYPIPAFLTPQDTDFGKSLLRFYEESYMTPEAEEWLAFQVATTYGLDKAPMDERLSWTNHNHTLISKIAKDPIGTISDWEAAEEPWQFLAACEEYYHCVIECDRHYTGLMVATDATCSGLQILAGLARDASTAALVNVLPGDRPQDAYKVIAEAAKPHVPQSIQPYMDRKVTKKTVMTLPYNSKPFSNRSYIRDALKEKGVEIEKDDLTATVAAVREAMNRIVPGPMAVMKWIEAEVAQAIRAGAERLSWRTPSGFVVTQKLMKKDIKNIELQLLGRCQISVAVGDTDEVDLNHHRNATAPNLIHSLDASLLHLATLRFNAPIALIHDSVLCRATDMGILSTLVRETYMHLFAEHDYLTDWAQQIGAQTEPPIIDTLEPQSVIESTYFFC